MTNTKTYRCRCVQDYEEATVVSIDKLFSVRNFAEHEAKISSMAGVVCYVVEEDIVAEYADGANMWAK